MAPTPVAPASALLQLSLDELGVVGLAISDPLRPSVAGAFAAACLTLQAAMVAPLARLQPQHVQAKALAARMGMTCAAMREATMLDWCDRGLTATDMGTLGMVMSSGSLPVLEFLLLSHNRFGNDGMSQLFSGLGCSAAPPLTILCLDANDVGPAGAAALAAAIDRGALPRLVVLHLSQTPLGDEGLAALARPLRRLRALKRLYLTDDSIGDRGVAALVENLGHEELKLDRLHLQSNVIGDTGCASLTAAIDGGALRRIKEVRWGAGQPEGLTSTGSLSICNNPASEGAQRAVAAALERQRSYFFSLELVPRAGAAQLAERIRQGGANPKQRIEGIKSEATLLQVVNKVMGKWGSAAVGEDSSRLRLWVPSASGGCFISSHSSTVGSFCGLGNEQKRLRLEYDLGRPPRDAARRARDAMLRGNK